MSTDNKHPNYHQVFISPFPKDTEGEALKVLQAIRDAHPPEAGWVEVKGFADKLPNGQYRAVREHFKQYQ